MYSRYWKWKNHKCSGENAKTAFPIGHIIGTITVDMTTFKAKDIIRLVNTLFLVSCLVYIIFEAFDCSAPGKYWTEHFSAIENLCFPYDISRCF